MHLGIIGIFVQILKQLVVLIAFAFIYFNFLDILVIIQGSHIMKTIPKMLPHWFIAVVDIISSLV